MSMEISQEDGATLRKLVPALNNIVNRICDKTDSVNENINRNYNELKVQLQADIDEAKADAREAVQIAQQCKAEAVEAKLYAKECKDAAVIAEQNFDRLEFQYEDAQVEIKELKQEVNDLSNYSRKTNLIARGIAEKDNDNCEHEVTQFFKNKLELSDEYIQSMKIVNCHRLGGQPRRGQSWVRPIIIRFANYNDKQSIWKCRQKLAKTGYSLSEQFSKNTDYNRRKLYPIYSHARAQPKYEKKVSLFGDTLRVNDVNYNVNTIHSLPDDLQPDNFSSKSNASTLVFGGILSESHGFSNWYPSPMTYEGQTYANLEQAYMFHKAIVNNDMKAARAIGYTSDPHKVKSIGSMIKVVNAEKWDQEKNVLMQKLVRAKFSQNELLRELLLSTGDKTLGETGKDMFFSIGLPLTHPGVMDQTKWKGDNRLGLALQTIRGELRA